MAVIGPAFDGVAKHAARLAALAPVSFASQARRAVVERRSRGREQWGKLRRADLVVVSFGKSGRTWLRVLLSRYFGARHGLTADLLVGFANLHWLNPAIPKIFFTHDNYTRDFTGDGAGKQAYADRAVILLARHPADVAVSQYHQWRFRMRPHKKALNAYPEHGQPVGIFAFVAQHPAGLAKVIEFMNEWAVALPTLGRVLVVRYEDMRADTHRELARIADFAAAPGTPEQIDTAVRYASFDNMKKLEERRVFRFTGGRMTAREKGNPDSAKVRRGKVGGWRDYFDEAQALEIDAIVDRTLLPGYGYTSAERRAATPAEAAEAAAATVNAT